MQLPRMISFDHFDCKELVLRVPGACKELPRLAYDGQDYTKFQSGLKEAFDVGGSLESCCKSPDVELNLHIVKNGTFYVGNGLDGVVRTSDGNVISETAAFSRRDTLDALERNEAQEPFTLGAVFIGFDGAWKNYFHWLCFAIAKSEFATTLLNSSTRVCLPDYRSAKYTSGISFSEETYNQSLDFSGLTERTLRLPTGAYKASEIFLLWTNPHRPTDYMHLPTFYKTFDSMIARAKPSKTPPIKLQLVRSPSVHSRSNPKSQEIVDKVLGKNGFQNIDFGNLTLRSQIELVFNADVVVSAHGAGMSNCLFGQKGLKVLELNKDLDKRGSLRPWFYMICSFKEQDYMWLDVEKVGDNPEIFDEALSRLEMYSRTP